MLYFILLELSSYLCILHAEQLCLLVNDISWLQHVGIYLQDLECYAHPFLKYTSCIYNPYKAYCCNHCTFKSHWMGKTSKWEKNIWKTRWTEWEHEGQCKNQEEKWRIYFLLFFFCAKVYITELTAIFINNVREHLFFKMFGLINNLSLHSIDMIFTGIWNPDTRQTPEIQHIQTSPTSLIRT